MNPAYQHQRLAQIGATANTLAALTGISSGSMSKYFSGTGSFGHSLPRKIDEALTGLERLNAAAYPLPVDFSQVTILKDVLEKFQNGELSISVVDNGPQKQLRPYVIRLSCGSGYYARNAKGEIVSVLNQFQATLTTEEVVNQVVSLLIEKGYKSAQKQSCTQGELDMICVTVADAWPVEENISA